MYRRTNKMNSQTWSVIAIVLLGFVLWQLSTRKNWSKITDRWNKSKETEIHPTTPDLHPKKVWYTKVWDDDGRLIFYTVIALVVINVLIMTLTARVPEIWTWYFVDNPIFFFFFNLGWVVVIYFNSKKDEETGKPVLAMQRRGRLIATVIIVATLINLFGTFRGNNSKVPAAFTPVNYKQPAHSSITKKPLPPQPVADAESGTCGVLGSAKQFLPGTTTPVRNPQNGATGTGAVGYWAINLSSPAVKALVDSKGLDVENNKEHNDAAASLLYEESGLRPWIASKHCWGDKIDGYLANRPLPYILDVVSAPIVGTWSEEVKNPLINGAKLRWGKLDDNKGGNCRVRFDKDDQKVFLIESSTLNLHPGILQFQCAEEGAEIRVRVVPK